MRAAYAWAAGLGVLMACGGGEFAGDSPDGADAQSPAGGSSGAAQGSSSGGSSGGEPTKEDVAARAPVAGFITSVESFEPGPCGGFNQQLMPGVVYGAPRGAGDMAGSLDVVSLGEGGQITLGFAPQVIVDGDGDDFVVFENVFFAGGNPELPFQEPAEVSVSADGETWHTFPCTVQEDGTPSRGCAGLRPTYSAPGGLDPLDDGAGGDGFDLAQLGLEYIQYVRLTDRGAACKNRNAPPTHGFDLDAIAVRHSAVVQ